jgi:hypothetical protein
MALDYMSDEEIRNLYLIVLYRTPPIKPSLMRGQPDNPYAENDAKYDAWVARTDRLLESYRKVMEARGMDIPA